MAIMPARSPATKLSGPTGRTTSLCIMAVRPQAAPSSLAAPLTITGSTFTDNLAKGGDQGNNLNPDDGGPFVGTVEGGGICEPVSSLTVTNTSFVGNQAIGGNCVAGVGGAAIGGGITAYVFASTTLTNVTFAGNQAIGGSGGPGYAGGSGFGGGFYNGVDSTAAVSGCLFSGNLAQGGAGGSGDPALSAGGAVANGGGVAPWKALTWASGPTRRAYPSPAAR